ncbi:MAG: alpha/beta hydrolase [Anaerolineaceae bacterium]|nr:alpha/beta hydrolase [Anaerolineaceae bacterium]
MSEMIELIASDGKKLYTQTWGDPSSAKAAVVLVHGLGEHIQRYNHVAAQYNARNIFVLGFDQRGHGQTQGKRGLIPSAQQMMDDITSAIRLARKLCPGKPVFLYGHSMGSCEVLYYGLTGPEKPAGILATSTPLYLNPSTEGQRKLARLFGKILPGLTIKNGLDANGLSRDKAVVKAYLEDPLVHPMASVRLANFLFDASEYVLAHAKDWNIPLYLAHGSADPICDIRGTEQFASGAPGDLTYKRWEGLYHETHNEPEQTETIPAMADWVESHLKGA